MGPEAPASVGDTGIRLRRDEGPYRRALDPPTIESVNLSDPRTGIEAIPRDECLRLLASVPLGRFVRVVGGAPHVVPVNHVVDGDGIVFRSDGRKHGRVAFEADSYDQDTRSGWSVVVHGDAEEVTRFDDPETWTRVHELPVDPWAGGEKGHWIRIRPTSITGRRL